MAPMMAHQYRLSTLLAPITMRVGSGSCRLTDANMFWKVGITKMSSTEIAMTATDMMTPGEIIAPLTLRTIASFFSRNSAKRTRMVSKMPPASPAATMLTYRSLNALGCLRRASASVWPLSTSYTTLRVTSARILFSVCCARMSRAWTSGRPALIIVANWRVNTTTSRVLTPPPNLKLSLNSLGAARTCTTTMRFFRRCAMTSSRVGRSILSLTRSPLSVRAVYWKTGMAHSLRAPLAARRHLGSACGGLAAGRDRLPVVERRLADHPQKLVRRRRHPQAFVLGDLAAHVQLVERIVQRLHPVLLARLHHGRDLLDLLVPNQRPYRGGHDEDLARHHAAAALGLLQQRLGDDTLEHERQLGAHLRLLVRREHVDDAVDALHRRIGVQRGEREMPRLGNRQRGGDGLEIAHFADQHDIGVLPQRVFERSGEAVGVGPDLALVHDAALMAVDELDRVLHRDDVPLQLLVDLVDQRRERGTLARPRGPRHEHQAAGPLGQLRHDSGQAQLLERPHVEGDLPDHERYAAALLEAVAAEPRQILDPEREIELVLGLEPLLLILGEHRVGDRQRVLGREHRLRRGVHDVPVHAQLGPLARHDVQVRRVPLDHPLEQGAQIHRLRSACGHAAVSFTTSSRVVMPRFTFSMPSMRSVSMPSFTACSRSSSVDPPFSTMRRAALVMAMTSYSPCRPLYPEPPHVSQPAPL